MRRRLVLIGASIAFGLGLPADAIRAGDAPAFVASTCDLSGVGPGLAARLQCGTVAVPKVPGEPGSGSFKLAVVILRSRVASRQLDPVVYVAGGPGSPLTSRVARIAEHEAGIVAPDRDLILVDQRGAGRSEPALCPGLARDQLAIMAAGADRQTLVGEWRASYATCRQQMAARGLRPEWFGTQVTAADLAAVRRALGLERWNVYALSYGTAVAMTMMATDPAGLRAVVLDSPFPPDPLPMTPTQTFGRALDLLFAACQADAPCAAAHPSLAGAYGEALRGLDDRPLAEPLPPGLGVATLHLRAQVFRLIVNRALYSREGLAALPSFIKAARDRRPAAMQELIGAVARGYAQISLGDMAAVECRDRPSWQTSRPSDSDIPTSAFVPGMCQDWSVPGPPPLLPRRTDIPTVVLAGASDPITPPDFARLAAREMGDRARVIVFSNTGHGVQQSPCAEAVISAFVRDPVPAIDATCASAVPTAHFR